MDRPCFDKKTHTDCPKRHSGCAIDCPEWAAYCVERDKEYERRAKVCKQNFILGKTIDDRHAKKLKREIEIRKYGFTK